MRRVAFWPTAAPPQVAVGVAEPENMFRFHTDPKEKAMPYVADMNSFCVSGESELPIGVS
jgi:hypothetical protein